MAPPGRPPRWSGVVCWFSDWGSKCSHVWPQEETVGSSPASGTLVSKVWGRFNVAGGQEAGEDGKEGGSATESTTCVHVCAVLCVAAAFRFSCRLVGCSPRVKLRRQHIANQHSKQAHHHPNIPNAKRTKQDAKPRQPKSSTTMQNAARINMDLLTRGNGGAAPVAFSRIRSGAGGRCVELARFGQAVGARVA